ncbi:jg23013 [Pararge aegeria aegeria]|uniref:Jg23013 protein n=1 Tax=Pararge aegeria aegeria TaxID=348720 RepID=A0A8S4QYK2_9NEOP|nr:jg23013 [Pararge aegeria aegeria]
MWSAELTVIVPIVVSVNGLLAESFDQHLKNLCLVVGSRVDYVFDGKDFHNIRWMINDIAVVKVDEEFNFERRIRGCDFIPKMISYNNQSESLEAPGTVASIAGWGSVDRFGDTFGRSTMNSPELLETDVILISKKKCQRQWPERYHQIIQENMVCAKDGVDTDSVSLLCKEKQINCKELVYSDEEKDENRARKFMLDPNNSQIHSSGHLSDTRRAKQTSGGFCEVPE